VRYKLLLALLLVIAAPAFILNLGGLPFIGDEGIRALVALEMDINQQYIAPTLYGEYYFKKPPLWNWIVLISFKLFGATPLAARIPTVFFLYLFTIHVFFTFRKHVGAREGLLVAALFLTCGRVLFWDSMLALIDICFSWVIFAMWVWIYEKHEQKKYLPLYLGTYFLGAIAFMLKALPALVFIALTLLGYQLYRRTFWKLLSWMHFAGIALLFSLVGFYLYLYQAYVPLADLLTVYLDESTQRTVVEHGILETIKQLFVFPVEMLYHYLPWSAGLVFVFHKGAWDKIKAHPFLLFCSLTFLVNIIIYWTSPIIYARYVIMFAPLYFGLVVFLYQESRGSTIRTLFDGFLIVLCAVAMLGAFVPPFYEESQHVPMIWLMAIGAFILLAVGLYCLLKYPAQRLFTVALVLVVLRYGFDLVILPLRSTTTSQAEVYRESTAIGKKYAGTPMYIFGDYEINHDNGFYLTKERNEIIQRTQFAMPGSYLLVQGLDYPYLLKKYELVDSVRIKDTEKYFHVVKVPDE